MEEAIKSLAENQIVLVLVPKLKYASVTQAVLKTIGDSYARICYAAFNKPYSSVEMQLKKMQVNLSKFSFIDILSGTVSDPQKKDNVVFVRSASALTDLGLAVNACMADSEVLIFDSVSTLLVYNPANDVENFLHHVITKERVSQKKMVLFVPKEEAENELIKNVYVFVDDVVEMES